MSNDASGHQGPPSTAPSGSGASLALLLAAIIAIGVNMRVTITGVGPLLEQISASTGTSIAVLSSLTSVPVILWAALSPFAHPLTRRFGLNRVVLWALLLLTAGTLIRSIPGPEVSLWLGTVLLGVALAVANVLMPAVAKRSFGTRVPLVTGLYTALFAGFGAIASGAVVPISYAAQNALSPRFDNGDLGWRIALVAVAASLPVAIGLWVAHMRRFGRDRGRRAMRGARRGPSVWGDPVAWMVGLYMGAQSIMFYVMITWLAPYARSLGRSEVTAGFDVMVFQLAGVIGSLALPLAMRGRLDRWLPAALPILSLAGVAGMFLAPGALDVWVSMAGLCSGASIAASLTLMATRAPDHQTSSALSGMAQSVGYAIAATAPVAFGALHSLTGGWGASFAFLFCTALAQGVIGLFAGRDRQVFDRAS